MKKQASNAQQSKSSTKKAPSASSSAGATKAAVKVKTQARKSSARLANDAATANLLLELQEQKTLLELQRQQLAEIQSKLESSRSRYAAPDQDALVQHLTFDQKGIRGLLDSAPDATVVTDHAGTIRLVNAEAVKLFGYERAALTGQSVQRLLPGSPRMHQAKLHQAYLAVTKRMTVRRGMELTGRRQDGSLFAAEITLSPLRTPNGIFVISVIRDISEQARIRAEIQHARRFAESTLEAIPASIVALNTNGTILSINQAWAAFAAANGGSTKSCGIGANYFDVCAAAAVRGSDEAKRFALGIRAVINGTSPRFSMEYACHSPTEKRWFVAYVTPFAASGPRPVVVAHVDISELKRAEEQIKESLYGKEILLQEVHHRVKNNLQIIASLISLQADRLNDARQITVLNDMRDRVLAMALAHERLDPANNPTIIEFSEYTRSLLAHLWSGFGTAASRVRLKLEVPLTPMPVGSAIRAGLILNELVTNVLKHAFPNGRAGEMTVALEHDTAANRLCLRVHDNGVGIPPGCDWQQTPSLGLKLVSMLAHQMRGRVEVSHDSGTEFRVTFAVIEASSPEPP